MDRRGAWTDGSVAADVDDLIDAVGAFGSPLALVSPEVGLTVVPQTASGRRFADELGSLNQRLAALCDRVVLVVAGQPLTVKEPAARSPPVTDFGPITAPDPEVAAAARARQDRLTKPPGSLGRLEDLSVWVASCQGVCPPRQFQRARVVVFAGDHGVTAAGVSAYPAEVTAQMVANFDAGGAAINVLAEAAGASVRVVDIAVDCRRAAVAVDRRAQGAARQRQHRRRGRAERRGGSRGDRRRAAGSPTRKSIPGRTC